MQSQGPVTASQTTKVLEAQKRILSQAREIISRALRGQCEKSSKCEKRGKT